jgi:hypothetical protein
MIEILLLISTPKQKPLFNLPSQLNRKDNLQIWRFLISFALGLSCFSRLEHLSNRITESLSVSGNLLSPGVNSPEKSENSILAKFCENYKTFDKLVLTWYKRMELSCVPKTC